MCPAMWARVCGVLLLCAPAGCRPRDMPAADCEQIAATPAAAPLHPGAIAVTLHRLAAGCGSVLVSNGIPLAPGMLSPRQLSQIRLFIGGKEQALDVEPLHATHVDGSLRAVLVQFNYPLNFGTPVSGQLVIGEARGVPDISSPAPPSGTPTAIVAPTDPDYLVSTELVGPTITVDSATRLTSDVARYEEDFRKFADHHWKDGGASSDENLYDRALIYYAWWVRSGNLEYWKRATALAVTYREGIDGAAYRVPAHLTQVEGLELHYLLTGDERSRYAVGRIGDEFNVPFYTENLSRLDDVMENRIQAKTLSAFLSAWRLSAPTQKGSEWAPLLRHALTEILSSQDTSGAYRFTRQDNQCGRNKPFMVGMLNSALIRYYTTFRRDDRIPPAVQRSIDHMWTHDWDGAAKGFVYLDGPCGTTPVVPAPDLNNLIVDGYGWTYRMTGHRAYRERAEEIFAGAVANAWLAGSKHFNQQYTTSFRYLAYRE